MNSRWILVRHGETEWNARGRAQGQADTPLNARGREQAALTAARLREVRFDAAYCSDLQRVVDTAEAITAGKSVALTKMKALREKHFGDWEGMTFAEVESQHPTLFRRLFDEDIEFAPPNGESDLALRARVKAAADGLLRAHADLEGNVLVAAHGGSLRAFITALMDMPPEYMWRLRLGNCGITVVNVFDGGAALELLNDTSHIEDALAH